MAVICCDEHGDHLMFVGLSGASTKTFNYNPPPTGHQRLPSAIVELYARLDRAFEAAVRKGGPAAEEDDSKRYALIKDPATRKLQLEVRQWVVDK